MKDSTETLVKTAKRAFSGTLLSRIAGMMRDMAMAYAFGTTSAVAAFLVAFRFSHLLRRLFGEGALQSAFIPHFEEIRKEDPDKGKKFFVDLFSSLSVFLIGIILFAMLLIFFSIHYFDFSEGNKEILNLTFLLMPSLLFICLFGLNASLLQCEKSYFTPNVAPVAFNLIWVAAAFGLRHTEISLAMQWLSFFVFIACFSQWFITVPKALKIIGKVKSISLFSIGVRGLLKPLFLGILGVAASQINNALDSIFARWADPTGPAYLWYALRVQQLPLALFGVAISGALLPPLTRALKNNDLIVYSNLLTFSIKKCFALLLPMTFFFLVAGDTTLNLIYGRGDFSNSSLIGTTKCLWGYSLGLLPMTLVLILAPAFYADKKAKIPALGSIISMGANILLNSWFIYSFNLGAASIALATSISAAINLAFLAQSFPYFKLINPHLWQSILKVTITSLFACLMVLAADFWLFNTCQCLDILNNQVITFPTTFISQISRLSFQSFIFILSLFSGAYLMKSEDLLNFIPYKKLHTH